MRCLHDQKFVLLLAFLSPLGLWSQNLVPNSSFEEGPEACGFTRLPELFNLPSWSLPTPGTTDIFSTQLHNTICWAHAPKSTTTNNFSPAIGHQFPRSGNRFIGIISIELARPEVSYREYLQVKLDKPLKAGDAYCAEMFVSLAEQPKYASNNLGLLFTSEMISQKAASFAISSRPQVYEPRVVTDSISWSRIAGIFTADSNYQYLTIGTFMNYADAKVLDKGGSGPDSWSYETAYYFVDDVSVVKAERQRFSGDTIVCPGATTAIEALVKWDSIHWTNLNQPAVRLSNGARLVASPLSTETYLVKGKICNTWRTDTLTIYVKPRRQVNLGLDTTLCKGESLRLSADSVFQRYQWSDGSISQSLVVSETGVYKFTGLNENGCESSDEVSVSFVEAPIVALGKDTLACAFYPLNAKGRNMGNLSYAWSNGVTDSVFVPEAPGVYWVTVKNECGQRADTIVINTIEDLFIPNVITPNEDKINDRFEVRGMSERFSPALKIYNSWGLEVYSNHRYNGSWPDNEILPGVYFFSLSYNNCRNRKGWIHVLK